MNSWPDIDFFLQKLPTLEIWLSACHKARVETSNIQRTFCLLSSNAGTLLANNRSATVLVTILFQPIYAHTLFL